MQALALDYQRKARAGKRLGLLVLVLGIISAFSVGEAFLRVQRENEAVETALARAEKKRVPVMRELSENDRTRFAEEIKLADSIAERLTLPWAELFEVLEASSSRNIALLALEPDVAKRILRITAEAANKTDMVEYVLRLNNDHRLLNVHLIDHQLQAQTPGEPVRFSVQASWAALKKREE